MEKISNNTHDYDTKLEKMYIEYLVIDNKELIKPMPFEKSIEEIKEYIKNKNTDESLKNKVNNSCDLMLNDRTQNYDCKNKINVEDLLPRTWRFIKYYDECGTHCFMEQIADIMNGSCSQGRVTRIFQFYSCHMISKDEIYHKCKKIIN